MLAGGGVVLGALLAALIAPTAALQCLGHDSAVATYPAGDIAVRSGNSLEIYCVVESPYNSSQLSFSRLSAKKTLNYNKPQIINETTARLYIEKPEPQDSMYDCQLSQAQPMKLPQGKRFCSNKVVVDTAPVRVKETDFQCRSYNLERFECKWRAPVHYYIKTNYSLSYIIISSGVPCAVRYNKKNNIYSCTFGGNTTDVLYAPYRNLEEYFNLTLTSVNRFGSITQNIIVDHFAVLIPGKPYNLIKLNLTADSVRLQWLIPLDVAFYAPGVDHRIKYQIKTVDNLTTWRIADVSDLSNINKTTYRYMLDKLPYAHWGYDVRVFIKSARAPDEEEFWSQFEATTFTTLSTRPPHPPRTEIGAFQSKKRSTKRDIYVYWQQIDEFDESGENFTYNVVVTDGAVSYTLQSNKSSYAYFVATLGAVNVSIASSNNYGLSTEKSYIYVPPESDILREPTSFTKTVFGNKTYDLRWHPPRDTYIDSYTLFWCSNTDMEQCNGKLNFTKVDRTETSYRIVVSENDKTYLFAISANRGELSSGMVWGSCNLPAEHATNKVAVFKRGPNLGRRSVELQWALGCSFSDGHVTGYNVTYCPRADNTFHCSGTKELYLQINDTLQNSVNITNLVPHSTYSFYIAVIYKDGTGYSSDGVDATTLEDKPSVPLNLKISNVSAHTMRVSWDPPALKNGILREYHVIYRNDDDGTDKMYKHDLLVADKSMQLKDERQEITLPDLQAFTNYTVRVQACTTDCSAEAVAGQVRTAFGSPSRIEMPSLNVTSLDWQTPVSPGGMLDLYEIEIRDRDKVLLKINSTGLAVHDVPQCELSHDDHSMLYYYVRAVNYDNDKYHGVKVISGNVTVADAEETQIMQNHFGPWNQAAVVNCAKMTSAVIFWIVGVVTAVVFVIIMGLGSRKIWIRFKTMTDIGPVLPPGLGPVDEKDSKYQLGGGWSPPGKNKEEKSFPASAGDEVLLLPPPRRAADNKDFSGSSDSTDSTTLSLTSKEPRERDAATSDDASDDSSLRVRTATTAEPTPPPPRASAGYKTFATRPTVPEYRDDDYGHDADSIGSDDLSDAVLPSGYVQTATLPPPASHLDIPSGYVRAQDATAQPQFAPVAVSFPPLALIPKPRLPENPLLPKFLPMEWKQTPEPAVAARPVSGELGGGKAAASAAQRAPVKPAAGYVTHADAVINKHLNIISNNQLGEEPALPDPNMSPEAYCRFAWNSEPSGDDNLHSLLSEERPSAPAPPLFALQAPKD